MQNLILNFKYLLFKMATIIIGSQETAIVWI